MATKLQPEDLLLLAGSGLEGTGSLDIDGDKLSLSWVPTNYTTDATPSEADNTSDLTAHLKGIDNQIANLGVLTVATFASGTHVMTATDEYIRYTGTGVGTDKVQFRAATGSGSVVHIKAIGAAPDLDMDVGTDTLDGVTGAAAFTIDEQNFALTLVDAVVGVWEII